VSAGAAIPWSKAFDTASNLMDALSLACERIDIAGSIRRLKPYVHDIELVAIPLWETTDGGDLWGTSVDVDLLEGLVATLCSEGILRLREVESHHQDGSTSTGYRNGEAFKALEFAGIPVDLFIVRPPAEWGVIYAIRTGPGDWNQRLVTDCQKYLRRVDKGRVYRSGKPVPCPEEEDFFAAIGQEFLAPAERRVEKVRIKP